MGRDRPRRGSWPRAGPHSYRSRSSRKASTMMIVMKQAATEDEIRAVIDRIESVGARAHPSKGDEVTVIGAIGDLEHIARLELHGAPGVDRVVPILKPYKLASNQLKHGERTVLEIGGR